MIVGSSYIIQGVHYPHRSANQCVPLHNRGRANLCLGRVQPVHNTSTTPGIQTAAVWQRSSIDSLHRAGIKVGWGPLLSPLAHPRLPTRHLPQSNLRTSYSHQVHLGCLVRLAQRSACHSRTRQLPCFLSYMSAGQSRKQDRVWNVLYHHPAPQIESVLYDKTWIHCSLAVGSPTFDPPPHCQLRATTTQQTIWVLSCLTQLTAGVFQRLFGDHWQHTEWINIFRTC